MSSEYGSTRPGPAISSGPWLAAAAADATADSCARRDATINDAVSKKTPKPTAKATRLFNNPWIEKFELIRNSTL